MTIEYDEIRITTRREINVCRASIKKLETFIRDMEEKYAKKHPDLIENIHNYPNSAVTEITRWHESRCALERWRQRLDDHLRIMNL